MSWETVRRSFSARHEPRHVSLNASLLTQRCSGNTSLLRRVRTVRCRKMSRGETQLHCSDSMPSGLTKMVITVGGQSTPRSCPWCPSGQVAHRSSGVRPRSARHGCLHRLKTMGVTLHDDGHRSTRSRLVRPAQHLLMHPMWVHIFPPTCTSVLHVLEFMHVGRAHRHRCMASRSLDDKPDSVAGESQPGPGPRTRREYYL